MFILFVPSAAGSKNKEPKAVQSLASGTKHNGPKSPVTSIKKIVFKSAKSIKSTKPKEISKKKKKKKQETRAQRQANLEAEAEAEARLELEAEAKARLKAKAEADKRAFLIAQQKQQDDKLEATVNETNHIIECGGDGR